MVFEIPDAKKSIGQNVFEVRADGKLFKLPKFDYISSRTAMIFDGADQDLPVVFDTLDDLATPKGLGKILLDAPVKSLQDFLKAWMDDSGLTPGEAEASGA